MKVGKNPLIIVFFIILCFACLSVAKKVDAGAYSSLPCTIYGTTISYSVAYPDSFYIDEKVNVSLTISVTFKNESISTVNITEIGVRVYDLTANLTDIAINQQLDIEKLYHSGGIWSTGDPIYTIEKPPTTETAFLNIDSITLYPSHILRIGNEGKQARLYIEIHFYFIDKNGTIVFRKVDHLSNLEAWFIGYEWIIYTEEGEAPLITLLPHSRNELPPLTQPLIFTIIVASCIITIIYIIKKRKGTKSNDSSQLE